MKYKLKKCYPGSPKLGYIVTKGTLNWSQLKDYPEFWEEVVEYPIDTKVFNEQTKAIYIKKEDGWYKTSDKTAYTDEMIIKANYINIIKDKVVEKDYEILSYFNTLNKGIYEFNENGNNYSLRKYHFHRKEYCQKLYKIHSVKRLSDGEIFNIGDYINIHSNNPCCERGIIVDFSFITDINNISHVKQPLFTTEDGVDIFDYSESFYWIRKDTLKLCERMTLNTSHNVFFKYEPNKELYFSTKEKAEEYILLNKPCLSINDVNVLKNIVFANWDKTLKDLVKSKI